MKWIHDLSVRSALLGAFALIAIVVIVFNGLNDQIMRKAYRDVADLSLTAWRLQEGAGEMKYIVANTQRIALNSILANDQNMLVLAPAQSNRFYELVEEMSSLVGKDDENLWNRIQNLKKSYRKFLTLVLSMSAHFVEGIETSEERLTEVNASAQHFIDELNEVTEEISQISERTVRGVHGYSRIVSYANLFSLGLVLLVITAALFFMEKKLSRPLSKLMSFVRELRGEEGGLSKRIASIGKDEIAELCTSLNRTLDRLEKTTVSRDQLMEEVAERTRVEEVLRKRTTELNHRVKELKCLFDISNLFEEHDISLDGIIQGIIDLIPPAWQYPEITCARAILEGREFSTNNFQETSWKEVCDITVHGNRIGTLEVGYLKEKPERDAGPFLKEERNLLEAIAERLGRIVEHKWSEKHIHRLTQQLMKAQESERQMISRELHDCIGQDLSTLKIGIGTLLDNQPVIPAKIRQRVSEFSQILQETIMAVRDLAYALRPASLDQLGLVKTIFQHCEDYSEKTGMTVDFVSAGMDDLRLDFDTEINLYRLIQEGLSNIRKHADANHVIIRLIASFPTIILRIEDNGKGFEVKQRLVTAQNEKRMGLRSMEERISLLGGKMGIHSRPSEGTKIVVEVPYKERNIPSLAINV